MHLHVDIGEGLPLPPKQETVDLFWVLPQRPHKCDFPPFFFFYPPLYLALRTLRKLPKMTPLSHNFSSAHGISYNETDTGPASLSDSGPLLSPINFHSLANHRMAPYPGNQRYDFAYTQLLDKYRNLEDQLAREIRNHEALQYVYALSLAYHNVTYRT